MRTVRVKKWCVELLAEGDRSTDEIRDFINDRSRNGTTSHALANILGRDRSMFTPVGKRYRVREHGGPYKVTVWSLAGGALKKLNILDVEVKEKK